MSVATSSRHARRMGRSAVVATGPPGRGFCHGPSKRGPTTAETPSPPASEANRRSVDLDGHLDDRERLRGLSALGSGSLELLEDVGSLDDLAEDRVLAVEPLRGNEGQEELAAVGDGLSGVGHREKSARGVLDRIRDLAGEL